MVIFSIPSCDVITHKKTEDLEYLWLKSKFRITNLGQNGLYYAEETFFIKIPKIEVNCVESIFFFFAYNGLLPSNMKIEMV